MTNVENKIPWMPYTQVCFDCNDLYGNQCELAFDIDAIIYDMIKGIK